MTMAGWTAELELHALAEGRRLAAYLLADRHRARERDGRTSGCANGVPTAEPRPMTMLNTPAGRPASSKQAARWRPVSGASWASFMTTVLPYASAGAPSTREWLRGSSTA